MGTRLALTKDGQLHKNCDTFVESTSISCYTEAAFRKARRHLAEIFPQ